MSDTKTSWQEYRSEVHFLHISCSSVHFQIHIQSFKTHFDRSHQNKLASLSHYQRCTGAACVHNAEFYTIKCTLYGNYIILARHWPNVILFTQVSKARGGGVSYYCCSFRNYRSVTFRLPPKSWALSGTWCLMIALQYCVVKCYSKTTTTTTTNHAEIRPTMQYFNDIFSVKRSQLVQNEKTETNTKLARSAILESHSCLCKKLLKIFRKTNNRQQQRSRQIIYYGRAHYYIFVLF